MNYDLKKILSRDTNWGYLYINVLAKIRAIVNFNLKRVPAFPVYLHAEPTNACNLACIMCPHKDMKRDVGFMDFSLYEKIVNEASQYHLTHLRLHCWGESLIHPRIADMVKYAKVKKIPVVDLYTNAMLLMPDVSSRLLDAGIDRITFSIDGTSKETLEMIRKWTAFEKVEDNVKNFLNLKKTRGGRKPFVQIQAVLMKENVTEIETLRNKWTPLVNRFNVVPVKTLGGLIEDHGLSPEKIGRRTPCSQLWSKLEVYWNGDVVPCGLDIDGRQVVGNVKGETISSIWQGKKIQAIRDAHVKRKFSDISLCSICNTSGVQDLSLQALLRR